MAWSYQHHNSIALINDRLLLKLNQLISSNTRRCSDDLLTAVLACSYISISMSFLSDNTFTLISMSWSLISFSCSLSCKRGTISANSAPSSALAYMRNTISAVSRLMAHRGSDKVISSEYGQPNLLSNCMLYSSWWAEHYTLYIPDMLSWFMVIRNWFVLLKGWSIHEIQS